MHPGTESAKRLFPQEKAASQESWRGEVYSGFARERLRRLMTGRLLVEQYGASLSLVVAASFAGVR